MPIHQECRSHTLAKLAPLARIGVLIAGVILLAVGALFYSSGANLISQVNACETGLLCSIGAGLGSLVGTNTLQQEMTTGQTYVGIGSLLALVGIILAIYGAVAKGHPTVVFQQIPTLTPTISQAAQPTQSLYAPIGQMQAEFKFCPHCGYKMAKSAQFCPSCGTSQA